MSQIIIKLMLTDASDELITKHKNAFYLLTHIAQRASMLPGEAEDRQLGEALIGDRKGIALTRSEYRSALQLLVKKNLIEILRTSRESYSVKDPTKKRVKGTLVKLLQSDVYQLGTEDDEDDYEEEEDDIIGGQAPKAYCLSVVWARMHFLCLKLKRFLKRHFTAHIAERGLPYRYTLQALIRRRRPTKGRFPR